MKNQKRAIRRAHRERLIKKYKDYEIIRWRYYNYDDPNAEENKLRDATRLVDHIAICSCSMCRNERRNPWLKAYDRLTMPEKRAYDSYLCDMEEVVDNSPEMLDNEY